MSLKTTWDLVIFLGVENMFIGFWTIIIHVISPDSFSNAG